MNNLKKYLLLSIIFSNLLIVNIVIGSILLKTDYDVNDVTYESNLNISKGYIELDYVSVGSRIVEYENFSTYNEVDDDGDITVNDYDITFDTFRRDSDSHIYNDSGIGFWNDFEMDVVVNVTDIEAGDSTGADFLAILDFSNVVASIATGQSAQDTLHIRMRQEGNRDDLFRWNFIQRTGGVTDFNYIQPLNTDNPLGDYWCKLKRNVTGVYFWAWNDEARTSLNWFKSETVNHASTSYRYVYAFCGINSVGDGADHSTGSVHNLDLYLAGFLGGYTSSGYGYLNKEILADNITLDNLKVNCTLNGETSTLRYSPDNSTWYNITLQDGTIHYNRSENLEDIYLLLELESSDGSNTPQIFNISARYTVTDDYMFTELLFGSGYWLGIILIQALLLIVSGVVNIGGYFSAIANVILIIVYYENITINSTQLWGIIIMVIATVIHLVIASD